MQYRNLGKSGIKVSALSFGAWVTFDDQVGEDVAPRLHGGSGRRRGQLLRQRGGYASTGPRR